MPAPQTPNPTHQQALDDLVAMGMDIARALHRTTQTSDPEVTPETAIAFDRVARAVRRCVALARALNQPVPDQAPTRAASRRQVVRAVEDAIQRTDRADGGTALRAELAERLDGPELDEELDARPVAEVIADICRDLGLADLAGGRPWARRSPAEVAALHRRAAAPRGAAAGTPAPHAASPGPQMFPARFRGK